MLQGAESDQRWNKQQKNKLKEKSVRSHSCCWQRQADPLTKDVWPERECKWRPERSPRSSSHKVCVCQLSSINDSPGRLCKGIGPPLVPSLRHTYACAYPHIHPHTHPGAQTPFFFPFHLFVKPTAGESHWGEIWKWSWWVGCSGSHPSFKSPIKHLYCS